MYKTQGTNAENMQDLEKMNTASQHEDLKLDMTLFENVFKNDDAAKHDFINVLKQPMPAIKKRQKLAEILLTVEQSALTEHQDTEETNENVEHDNGAYSITSVFANLKLTEDEMTDSDSSDDENLKSNPFSRGILSPNILKIPGLIETLIPKNFIAQKNVKNLLKQAMPAAIKKEKLTQLFAQIEKTSKVNYAGLLDVDFSDSEDEEIGRII